MKFLTILGNLLPLLGPIAQMVEANHPGQPAATKTQLASGWLSIATAAAASVLPPGDAQIATAAGNAAQNVLATVVQAVHDASNNAAVVA